MPEQPHKILLNREKPQQDMAKGFGPQLDLLTQMANYASNLIPRAYIHSEKKLRDLIVCHTLLKQIAAMLDAVEVLARAGAITAAYLPARTAFEATLYLEWILVSDGEKKATYYYVSNIRAERRWAQRAIRTTPEGSAFVEDMKQLGEDLYSNNPELTTEGQKLLAEVDRLLALSEFAAANSDFEKYITSRKIKHEPEWYKVLGKRSVRVIASDLRRLPEYIGHYGRASNVMHSSTAKDHVAFREGNSVVGHPIRNIARANSLFHFVLSNAMFAFHSVLKFYRPQELPQFGALYVNEWRAAFRHIPEVKIELVTPKP
jgi:Family of unknown function (DUF5677)